MLVRFAMLVLILVGTSVAADIEIHRCVLEDGTVAFQELPCADPADNADDGGEANENNIDGEAHAANDGAFDFVNPFDEPASPPTQPEAKLPESVSQDRAKCEKTTRDAIDAIDLELRKSASSEKQGREHLSELLALTQQLRACKQLSP